MTRNNKLILAGIIGFILLTGVCLCVAVPVILRAYGPKMVNRMVVTTPEQVKAAAAQMLHYDLPDGFSEQMVMNSFGVRMLSISSSEHGDTLTSITIAQYTLASAANNRQVQQQQMPNMDRWLKAFGVDEMSMKPAKDRFYTINGSPVRFAVMETSYQGKLMMRQMSSDLFSLGDKSYMIQVNGTSEGWDDTTLKNFFNSIRPVEP